MSSGATPARSRAPLIANPPSWAPEKSANAPLNLPIAVRAPETMTVSDIEVLLGGYLEQSIRMEIDHIALAVDSMDQALATFKTLYGLEPDHTEDIASDKVAEAMLPVGNTYL